MNERDVGLSWTPAQGKQGLLGPSFLLSRNIMVADSLAVLGKNIPFFVNVVGRVTGLSWASQDRPQTE